MGITGGELAALIRGRGTVIRNHPACINCGADEWVLLSSRTRDREDIGVVGCCRCGLGRLDPLPSSLSGYYEREYREAFGHSDAAAVRALPIKLEDTERRIDALEQLAGTKARVLDVGCGSGAFLHRWRAAGGCKIAGVEPDGRFRESLIGDGFDVRPSAAAFTQEHFDIVVLFHVLEHVEDPASFVRALAGALKPGGTLVVEVPSLTDPLLWAYDVPAFWCSYWQFAHIWYFSPAPLQAVLERGGYAVECLRLVQRYGLANHLSWLNSGHGGDHRFHAMALSDADRPYRQALIRNATADTIWAVCRAVDGTGVRSFEGPEW